MRTGVSIRFPPWNVARVDSDVGFTWVDTLINFWWVCAVGLSEPPTPLYSILWPVIATILVSFEKKNFGYPDLAYEPSL